MTRDKRIAEIVLQQLPKGKYRRTRAARYGKPTPLTSFPLPLQSVSLRTTARGAITQAAVIEMKRILAAELGINVSVDKHKHTKDLTLSQGLIRGVFTRND